MSKAKMLVPANLPGVQVPDEYMLVQQVEPVANTASNSKPQPTYGKKWSRNQRRRKLPLTSRMLLLTNLWSTVICRTRNRGKINLEP